VGGGGDMNRILKFRAWDNLLGIMIDVPMEILTNQQGNPETLNDALKCFELMQYTGLKDKNEKEIYCSDYVQTPADIGRIVWDKCYWIEWQEEGRTTLHDTPSEKMEVIGNEYENKKW